MKDYNIPNEEKNLIIQLWKNGSSISQIIRMLPYSANEARDIIHMLIDNGTLQKKDRQYGYKKAIAMYETEKNPYVIAENLGLKPTTVQTILSNAKLIGHRPEHNYKKRKPTNISTLTDKTKAIIIELQKGDKHSKIAKEQGVSRQYVHKVYSLYVKNTTGN